MKLNDHEIKIYSKAVKRTGMEWYIAIGYIPIWIAWIFLINFYGWPRLEVPLATALLFILATPLYRSKDNRHLVALLEKLGTEHPELGGSTDGEQLSGT